MKNSIKTFPCTILYNYFQILIFFLFLQIKSNVKQTEDESDDEPKQVENFISKNIESNFSGSLTHTHDV